MLDNKNKTKPHNKSVRVTESSRPRSCSQQLHFGYCPTTREKPLPNQNIHRLTKRLLHYTYSDSELNLLESMPLAWSVRYSSSMLHTVVSCNPSKAHPAPPHGAKVGLSNTVLLLTKFLHSPYLHWGTEVARCTQLHQRSTKRSRTLSSCLAALGWFYAKQ